MFNLKKIRVLNSTIKELKREQNELVERMYHNDKYYREGEEYFERNINMLQRRLKDYRRIDVILKAGARVFGNIND